MILNYFPKQEVFIVNNNSMFYYEHIGHMQFSVLTLTCYRAILELNRSSNNRFVLFEEAVQGVIKSGFSRKQVEGELDRFCYGFECQDRYDDCGRLIAFTETGLSFLKEMLRSVHVQRSQMALLIRAAKKQNHFNVILQETTFFPEEIYAVIKRHNLRSGGCRDFKRCLSANELHMFCLDFLNALESQTITRNTTLDECIRLVENEGRFWASVGGKYSWFVFPQRFEVSFSNEDWVMYDEIVDRLVRPPEWGGGKDVSYDEMLSLLGNDEKKFELFHKHGVIRPLWISPEICEAKFRLTAFGYLIWERKKKGPINEFWAIKRGEDNYELSLCVASDFESEGSGMSEEKSLPSLMMSGTREEIAQSIIGVISKQGYLF